jgi:hypothetical protein
MGILDKAAILAAQDIKYEVVAVPEWGGDVRVRSMTGCDRDAWEQALMASRSSDAKANFDNIRARMVALSVVDESGARLFDEADIVALGGKSAKALDRVYEAATRLNAIGDEEVAALGKPSAEASAAASGSDSPAT